MVKLGVLLAIFMVFLNLLSKPYFAPLAYQALSISQAHKIWFWAFEGIPAFKIFAGFSIIGWGIAALRKKIDFSLYADRQNVLLLLLYMLVVLSDFFSPFPEYFAGVRANVVIGALSTVMIMYFVTIGLCCNDRALKALVAVFIITVFYFIYWANSAYFNQEWGRFFQGRLKGIPNSQYGDGNLMSVVYVMGMPYILLGYGVLKNKYIKYGLLASLPFLWHAIFLFGSRGAMLGLLMATLAAVYFLKSKLINWGVVVALIIAFATQGGALLERSESTVASANDIYSDKPLNPRLVSWGIGLSIISEYPLLGAGSQRFQTASAYLRPGESPHVAHNTLISVAANSGVTAGVCFMLLLLGVWKNFRKLQKNGVSQLPFHDYVNKASCASILGFAICSVFLDMLIFELFYIVLMISLINRKLAFDILNNQSQLK